MPQLEDVVQRFIADTGDYIRKLLEAKAAAEDFNRSTEKSGGALADFRRRESEAATAMEDLSKRTDRAASDIAKSGDKAGQGFFSKFASWLVPGKFVLITSGIAAAMSMLPALGAIGGAGLMIGLGAEIANKIPAVHKQFQAFGKTAMGILEQSVKPMIVPLTQALSQMAMWLKDMQPLFQAAFGAVGPLIRPLLIGFEEFIGRMMPGLITLLHAAMPAIQVFASLLGDLGSSLGAMFRVFATAIGPSSVALNAILSLVNDLLPIIAQLAAVFAQSLAPVLVAFGGAIKALTPALTIIGRILGELAGAVLRSLAGALGAVAKLLVVIAPSFDLLAKVLAEVFTAMENSGVFGTLEDALETLAVPLGQLINTLITQLLPVFVQLLPIIITFAGILSGALGQALADVATGLNFLFQHLPWLAPTILAIVAAIKAWAVVQAVIDALMDANPIGLIIVAIAALIAIIVEVVKHWKTISRVAKEVFGDVLKIIKDVIDWVKGHWPLLLAILTGPIGMAVLIIVRHWNEIVNGVKSMWSAVTGWFRRLPGDILRAVGNLGSLLLGAGRAIISGLIHGIESAAGGLWNTLSGIAGHASSIFSKVLHILSPSKVFAGHGSNIVLGLIQGIQAATPQLAAAMKSLAGAVNLGYGTPSLRGYGSAGLVMAGGGGAGGVTNVNVHVAGSVVTQQQLQSLVQTQTLRYTRRNQGNGLFLGNRQS